VSAFSSSFSRINPCFTAGKRIGVWNCHATYGHQKTTIFTTIVYERESPNFFISSEAEITTKTGLFLSLFDPKPDLARGCQAVCERSYWPWLAVTKSALSANSQGRSSDDLECFERSTSSVMNLFRLIKSEMSKIFLQENIKIRSLDRVSKISSKVWKFGEHSRLSTNSVNLSSLLYSTNKHGPTAQRPRCTLVPILREKNNQKRKTPCVLRPLFCLKVNTTADSRIKYFLL
jgi:hypothetical protein